MNNTLGVFVMAFCNESYLLIDLDKRRSTTFK